ncbi:MAG: hypothetical protein RSB71_02965 [Bacilli bacterium]
MRKDRNCGAGGYPIYPTPGMGPMMMPNPMMPQMMPQMMPNTQPNGAPSCSNNSLEQQVNNLEKRVLALENLMQTPNNNYNTSNFQMM